MAAPRQWRSPGPLSGFGAQWPSEARRRNTSESSLDECGDRRPRASGISPMSRSVHAARRRSMDGPCFNNSLVSLRTRAAFSDERPGRPARSKEQILYRRRRVVAPLVVMRDVLGLVSVTLRRFRCSMNVPVLAGVRNVRLFRLCAMGVSRPECPAPRQDPPAQVRGL
jgi:hypothetical protein